MDTPEPTTVQADFTSSAKADPDPILVSVTDLRRDMAKYFGLASRGEIVVITKEGVPYLQLVPVRYRYYIPDVLEQSVPRATPAVASE
jgi:antitoxin (DNA-binding transcriptional repressor) of toxin-antitoxin stability system